MKRLNEWINQLTYADELRDFIQGVRDGKIWQYSVFIAYYTAVTTFPLVVGILNVFSYFQIAPDSLITFIQRVMPGPFASWIADDLQQIYEASNVTILVAAAVTTIWTISWAMAAMQMGLNGAYGVKHRRNLVVLRLIAFLLTFVFAGAAILLFAGVSALEAPPLIERGLYLLSVGILFAMLYYLVPNVQQKWSDVLPGTLFSMVIFFLAATVYTLFLGIVPENSIFYTTIGAFTFVMVLLQLMNMMVLTGGIMNAVLQRRKYGEVTEKNENSKFLRVWDAFWSRMKK